LCSCVKRKLKRKERLRNKVDAEGRKQLLKNRNTIPYVPLLQIGEIHFSEKKVVYEWEKRGTYVRIWRARE
jgi:hypothetical protein